MANLTINIGLKLFLKPWCLRITRCSSTYSSALKESYCRGEKDPSLLNLTVAQILDNTVSKHGDKEAVIVLHQNVRKTFREFQDDVNCLSNAFIQLGLSKGSRIGMCGPNSYEWILTQYAATQSGFILVTINPGYQINELEYCLNKVGCQTIVMPSSFKNTNYYKMLCDIIPSLSRSKPGQIQGERIPTLSNVILTDNCTSGGAYNFSDVMSIGQLPERTKLDQAKKFVHSNDPAKILFTSGTTGHSKGVTLTHHNIVNNANLVGVVMQYYKKNTRICIPVPLYHCFGSIVGSLSAVIHGATMVFPAPQFNAEQTLKAIQDEKCTVIYGTPTFYIDMLNLPNFDKYNLSSLWTGFMTGSPCPEELVRKTIHKMASNLTICYGSTETSPVSLIIKPTDSEDKRVSCVGQPMPHTEIKIVDSEGNIVPINAKGELLSRGYCNMLGYWQDILKTREVIDEDNWYKSGDIAVMDEQGYVRIEGRIKDLVIRGGTNIYPAEIEQFLYTHPSVEEVQVIGVPDERLGEELCAWIRLKPSHEISEEQIKSFCKAKISHFKIPRYIVFRSDFPKTVSGKIQKFKMRELTIDMLKEKRKSP